MAKSNLVYPYTCPFFRPDNAIAQGYGFSDCIHWWKGCALRREVCAIALDLNVEGVPTNAEELIKIFAHVPEGELATIRANVEQFFRTLEVSRE